MPAYRILSYENAHQRPPGGHPAVCGAAWRMDACPGQLMHQPDEGTWLPAARRGERWALEIFYHAYSAPVRTLCYRLLGRIDDAEDAMQAAFVRAFRALPAFRGDCPLKAWLYRIAVNEAILMLRKRRNDVEWDE